MTSSHLRARRIISVAALAIAIGSGTAAAASDHDTAVGSIRESVSSLNGGAAVESIRPAAIAGVQEVIAEGQVLYFTDDGKHLIAGEIYDVASRENLTERARGIVRASHIASSDRSTHVRFGDAESDKVIYVFTDTTCAYCQRFHQEVPKLVAAGITVEYLAWPRGGTTSPALGEMTSIWCASDKAGAYTNVVESRSNPTASCDTPIAAHHALGEKIGVNGTPAIYTADGQQLGGYVPAARIIDVLSSKVE